MTKPNRSVAGFSNPFEDEFEEDELEEESGVDEDQEPEQEETVIQEKPSSVDLPSKQESSGGFLDQFYEKKETKEDTHSRKTFLVENELLDDIEKYSKKLGYGFQIKFINEAIRNQLAVIKADEQRLKGKRRK